ncbi:hypothetical protein AMTRI_Chr01g136760 [Amborella trichopoda]|uniref:Uncharacterized protein n=1 Tax=Amborella trichopoda TaxID=13333 RepID=W1PXB6_AMBTC|nr:protein MLP1 homolog [Amborella trichopoda]XP_011625745.1 protein MLP1 homolog [Amborella trichopoda]ERN12496.1 hypothetical protein AMTR_s00025p00174890 [Amborella trichopoda]|eukprot:XP_006850915.1 protein MLP1 homolog [Amborella trichopoda]
MASTTLVAWLLLFVSVFAVRTVADAGAEDQFSAIEASLRNELKQLQSKVSILESNIKEKIRELERKDERIAQMEKLVQEKSEGISSLQNEIDSLQKRGTVDAEEQVAKAHARIKELELQVNTHKKEIEMQSKIRNALDMRANESENRMKELNSSLEKLQEITQEQKARVRKAEQALKAAEENLLKARLEAKSKAKKLTEVHGAWLPPWLAVHFVKVQSFAVSNWHEHVKPILDIAVGKASETSAKAQALIKPHVERINSKLVPYLNEQWLAFTTFAGPYVQLATTKTIKLYEESKSTIRPHILKAQEMADPYLQEAKKFSKPYIDQVAVVTKPHVEKLQVAMKPYTKKAVHAYGKFLKTATVYHHQAQSNIEKMLKQHELTKALATKELVWFLASALLALPVFALYSLFSSIFGKKVRKPTRSGNHAHRRLKRRHADK